MEFIDNSLDSAEQNFDRAINSYNRNIKITLEIQGSSHKDGKIVLTDNCSGIINLPKVVQSVGYSDKKAQAWTNGQFGYGIYSFMAICEKLEIISKLPEQMAEYIPIERKKFDAKRQEDVYFPSPTKIREFPSPSGTQIILSGFDKFSWKQLNIDELKNEIEKHFELLLSRNNLKIRLIDNNGNKLICNPFNYDEYEGDYYEEVLKELKVTLGRKNKIIQKIILSHPVKIFIKVTTGQTIDKNPVFISKGRRIGGVKDIRAFKSKHKSDLWGHPNVTGFIDVGDILQPTIARNEFTNTQETRALFETLMELEPLIIDVVNAENRASEERHYKELEDQLNQALSKLAKLDSMFYRTEYLTGQDINLAPGGSGQTVGEGIGGSFGPGPGGEGPGIGDGSGNGSGPGGDTGQIPGSEDGMGPKNKEADNPFEDTGFKGGERRKSGFNIRIVDDDLQIDAATNKPLRSQLIGNQIRIFKKHPDFEARVDESSKKQKRITQRLITYLAGEITVHYKDKFHCKHGQPAYNKNLFVNLVEFIYQFENMLKGLVGRNLSDIPS